MQEKSTVRRVVWWLLGLGLVALIIGMAVSLRAVTVPFVLALALAYLADPAVNRLEGKRVPRTLATTIVTLGGMTVLGLILGALIPTVVAGLEDFPAALGEARDRVAPTIERSLGVSVPNSWAAALDTLKQTLSVERAEGDLSARRLADIVFGASVSLGAAVAGILIVPVLAFLLARDFPAVKRRIQRLVPPSIRPEALRRARDFDTMLGGFVRGQLLVAGILSVIYAVGLSILGVRLGVVIGLLAGLGNMIPYFGTAVGVLLATIMTLVDWHGWVHLVGVWGVFLGAQVLEGWFLTPRIVGTSATLPPLGVLLAIIGFGEMFGFFGLLMAVPLAAAVKVAFNTFEDHFLGSLLFTDQRIVSPQSAEPPVNGQRPRGQSGL